MKVAVVTVGKPRGVVAAAAAEYERRAARYWTLRSIRVRAARGRDANAVLRREGEAVLDRLRPEWEVVALTRSGQPWSSAEWAERLGRSMDSGRSEVALVVGGAFGLDASVVERADHLVSLSALTLPHEFAELLVMEQLYRAGTIRRGEPYHKGPR